MSSGGVKIQASSGVLHVLMILVPCRYLDPDMYSMIQDSSDSIRSTRFQRLTEAICGLVRGRERAPACPSSTSGCDCGSVQIEDYSMVRFLPFDCTDEEGVNIVLQHIDFSIQYGEDLDFKEPKVKESTQPTLK